MDDPGIDFDGKRVFCRLDLNVPVDDEGEILDDSRIKAALPTLNFLLERKAKVIIASHLGRPKGKFRKNLSMVNVAERLNALLGREITFIEDCIGDGVRRIISDMSPSQAVVLENLRFHSGEEKSDDNFAKMLAQNIDIYVGDAFGAMHRSDTSVAMLPGLVSTRLGGLLVRKELEALNALVKSPARPFVAVLGGAKVSDKIGVIARLLTRIDTLVIGGAMAYTFLKAKGIPVGASRVEDERIAIAKSILEKAAAAKVSVLLPVDHVAMKGFSEKGEPIPVGDVAIPDDLVGVDIGPKSRTQINEALVSAKTIFWNGPMGVFEWSSAHAGTKSLVESIAAAKAFKVAGGGDSIAAINKFNQAQGFSHISTGGGASLEFLEGTRLPGLVALGYGS